MPPSLNSAETIKDMVSTIRRDTLANMPVEQNFSTQVSRCNSGRRQVVPLVSQRKDKYDILSASNNSQANNGLQMAKYLRAAEGVRFGS